MTRRREIGPHVVRPPGILPDPTPAVFPRLAARWRRTSSAGSPSSRSWSTAWRTTGWSRWWGRAGSARPRSPAPWPPGRARGSRSGAHFVDLTRVDDAEAVGGALAAQLGFPSFRALVDSPSDQPALLVVDNCEHVLDAAAEAIDELLASCDAPTVVPPAGRPSTCPASPWSCSARCPSGRPRERTVPCACSSTGPGTPGADLTDHDRQSVADLCRALDGVPLAVEIAAARSRVLSPAEILDRLDDLDTLLAPGSEAASGTAPCGPPSSGPTSSSTGPSRRCSIASGSRPRRSPAATAHAVAGEPGAPPSATEGHLEGLVRVSLLVTEVTDGATRYRQLHPVRTFARERLVARGEHDEICDRYVDHLVATGTALRRGGRGGWTADGLTEPPGPGRPPAGRGALGRRPR